MAHRPLVAVLVVVVVVLLASHRQHTDRSEPGGRDHCSGVGGGRPRHGLCVPAADCFDVAGVG